MNQQITKEELVESLQNLSFIHNKLLTTSFYPEEFKNADKALRMIESMAKKIDASLVEMDKSAQETESSEVVSNG